MNQEFDPKPLIRTFEHAQARLNELSGDLEIRENELSAAARRAEAQHEQNTSTLGKKLRRTIGAFHQLDSSFDVPGVLPSELAGGTGNMAVETGRKLEEIDRQRRRAKDAHFLIQCWDDVSNRGDLKKLEELRTNTSGEDKVRSAQIARQLLRISQRLDPKSWDESGRKTSGIYEDGVSGSSISIQNGDGQQQQVNGSAHTSMNGSINGSVNGDVEGPSRGIRRNTREMIEKFSETLEKDLLKQFDDFYRKDNFEGMKDCATVLHDFNGGASVIALFVNQHQFFIDRSQLVMTEEVGGDPESWEKLADPDSEPPGVEQSLQSLIDEVKVVVQDESAIIKRAFPYYEQVLGKFLQRVFQQSIQQRLEMVLDKANGVSSLAFLRSLQSSRNYVSALVEALKVHGLTEHPEPISTQSALVLDQQLEELFVPYFVGSSYIEREKKNLEDLYTSLLFKFTTYHARRKKAATTFMASLAKSGTEVLSQARDAYVNRLESSELAPTHKKVLLQVADLRESTDSPREIKLTEEDGLLNMSHAKRMLKWLAEGVGRGLELSVSNETPKDVLILLNLLLTVMAENYIEVSLDGALETATAQESAKTEPDFSYLPTLRTAVSMTNLMVTCINQVLIPLASGSITVRREMEKRSQQTMTRIEEKINTIEQKAIEATMTWIIKLLWGQKKNDFRPREGDSSAWLEKLQTQVSTTSNLQVYEQLTN